MSARASLTLVAAFLLSSSAVAAPSVSPQFSSHAVLQRGKPIVLTGTAAPDERVNVRFAGQTRSVLTNSSGDWTASFPALGSGGPYKISVEGRDGTAAADDIMVGDVWLCSGQSNMEYPLRRALNGDGEVQSAADSGLRLLKVPQQLADSAQQRFAKIPAWQRSTPETARDFSAACFFMARDLRKTEKVAVGAIDDSWGGTPIRAWMSESGARSTGGADAADLLDLYRRDKTSAIRQFGNEWGRWWRSKTGDPLGSEPWNATDRLTWSPVPSLSFWDNWGPQWKAWIGSAWVRKRVTLTAEQAGEPAILSLSAIDDMDETFVNGIPVGGKNDPANPRSYDVPRGVLRPGLNEILIFVRNVWGTGGLAGPADKFSFSFADGHSIPLTSGWEYSRIAASVGDPPGAPWANSSGVSTIYNGMVAPLGALPIKGVAWYQGEADVGKAGYDARLAALMASWRAQLHDANLPFLIVGLAGWGKPVSRPVESGWAALINEQRVAVRHDPRAALASAIDLGEPADIHPANKQEVGRRLALAAHSLVYRDGGTVGPLPVNAVRDGNRVVVTFTKPLQVLSGATANAVELCAASGGTCRYAQAQVQGAKLLIALDGSPVTRLRYAWADYPVVNLYDLDLLPVPVFELPVQ